MKLDLLSDYPETGVLVLPVFTVHMCSKFEFRISCFGRVWSRDAPKVWLNLKSFICTLDSSKDFARLLVHKHFKYSLKTTRFRNIYLAAIWFCLSFDILFIFLYWKPLGNKPTSKCRKALFIFISHLCGSLWEWLCRLNIFVSTYKFLTVKTVEWLWCMSLPFTIFSKIKKHTVILYTYIVKSYGSDFRIGIGNIDWKAYYVRRVKMSIYLLSIWKYADITCTTRK